MMRDVALADKLKSGVAGSITTWTAAAWRTGPLVAFTMTNSAIGPWNEELKVAVEATAELPVNMILLGAKDTDTSEISGGLEDVRVTVP
jgi:hypothetical protein